MTNKKTKKNQKGFTLIELIVVIAILGILAAIAIPSLTGIRESANRKAIVSNLKTINNAIAICATELNIDKSSVDKDLLLGETEVSTKKFLETWPAGPTANVNYTIDEDGVAVAVVEQDIPGVPAGEYVLSDDGGELKEKEVDTPSGT